MVAIFWVTDGSVNELSR